MDALDHGGLSALAHVEADVVAHVCEQAGPDPVDLYLEFPDNTPLFPNQTYWAVFEEVSGLGVYEISTAPNGDEDPDSWPSAEDPRTRSTSTWSRTCPAS